MAGETLGFSFCGARQTGTTDAPGKDYGTTEPRGDPRCKLAAEN